MTNYISLICCSFLVLLNFNSYAAGSVSHSSPTEITSKIYTLSNAPKTNSAEATEVGTITFKDAPNNEGLSIQTKLKLPKVKAGTYGFHIHNNPSCEPDLKNGKMTAGMAAGDHLDPKHTTKHLGPYSKEGHLGDLPLLLVDKNGEANRLLVAPNLKLSDVINRSVMIHAGSDNYSDKPAPLGGGGARRFCGVIKTN